MSLAPERRVSAYLVSRPNADLCDVCIAERTDLPLSAVMDQVRHLANTPVYLRDVWKCADCGEQANVTRAIENRA